MIADSIAFFVLIDHACSPCRRSSYFKNGSTYDSSTGCQAWNVLSLGTAWIQHYFWAGRFLAEHVWQFLCYYATTNGGCFTLQGWWWWWTSPKRYLRFWPIAHSNSHICLADIPKDLGVWEIVGTFRTMVSLLNVAMPTLSKLKSLERTYRWKSQK